MNKEQKTVCILCDSIGSFTSVEHIIPEGLGNDFLILPSGLVCDKCNNLCSAFESRVVYDSILGLERCRMGVITKKNKPARSRMHGITWLADPESGKNIIQAEANWQKVFAFWSKKNASGKIILPVHDKSCFDIAKMLLKIGVEIFVASGLASRQSDANMLKSAKEHIIRAESEPWPYFLIRDDFSKLNLVSLFYEAPEVHDYLKTLGFDLFFHSIEDNVILFFSFGDFRAALSITSRTLILREYLNEKGLSAVPCPGVFDRN